MGVAIVTCCKGTQENHLCVHMIAVRKVDIIISVSAMQYTMLLAW